MGKETDLKIIDDIEKYKSRIEREVERKNNMDGKNIFFDYDLKFSKSNAEKLKVYLEETYPDVEFRSCPRGVYDIIIKW